MSFQERLRNARKNCGLTQQQVAQKLGVTPSTYCGYETGKREPDVEKVKLLASILHISADALLDTNYASSQEESAMPIGNRLKEARIQRGLTQEELARAVGVTKGAIGNYETGVSSPKASVLIKLMQVLEIDANYIYQDFITPHKDRITPEEARVLTAYRAAEATYRKVALELLETHPASTPARQTLA